MGRTELNINLKGEEKKLDRSGMDKLKYEIEDSFEIWVNIF